MTSLDEDLVPEDLVLVGRIARPHGLRGQVIVDPETDFVEERFAPGAAVIATAPTRSATTATAMPASPGSSPGSVGRAASRATLRIVSMRLHRGRPIVGFEGIDTIEQAEALGRADLWIPAASRPALPDGQFYHDALIGCRVETTAGEVVGTVTRIDGGRGMPLLVVDAPGRETRGRREVLVPLAEAICPVIDPAGRRIVIEPPEGLLDVNG